MVLVGRVWDAVTDPVVGYLTQKTHTRWGRFRPWYGVLAEYNVCVCVCVCVFVPNLLASSALVSLPTCNPSPRPPTGSLVLLSHHHCLIFFFGWCLPLAKLENLSTIFSCIACTSTCRRLLIKRTHALTRLFFLLCLLLST